MEMSDCAVADDEYQELLPKDNDKLGLTILSQSSLLQM